MWMLTIRDLRYRAVRFLVVTIGTALVFTLLFLMTGLVEQFNREPFLTVESISEASWTVPEGTSGPFTSSSTLRPDQVEALGGEPLLIARGTLEIDGVAGESIVAGHQAGGLVSPPLVDGRRPASALEALVDVSTDLSVGDSFMLGGSSFSVVGTTDDTTLLAGQPMVFVLLEDARHVMFGGAEVTMAVLSASPPPMVEGTTVLTAYEVAEDALGPLENAISSVDLIRVLLWVVAGIIIGAVVYLSALERQRDFAVMLAVGGKARQLSGSLAIQAVFVALLAVGLAAVIQALVVPVFPLKVRVPVRALWQLPLVAVAVSLLAASAAMRRVRRTDPAAAFGGPA
jgi:putative ABC transport system permease protein